MSLDEALIAAHARGDHAQLVVLYAQAGVAAASPEARGFFLTQAYIFALEHGHAEAASLRAELTALGCEPPLC